MLRDYVSIFSVYILNNGPFVNSLLRASFSLCEKWSKSLKFDYLCMSAKSNYVEYN